MKNTPRFLLVGALLFLLTCLLLAPVHAQIEGDLSVAETVETPASPNETRESTDSGIRAWVGNYIDLSFLENPPDFILFMGRFHPITLHMPIGLLVALFLYEIVLFFRGSAEMSDPARWLMLILGSLSAVIAAVLGVFLSWSGGYDADLVFWHQWTGIAVAVTAVLALVLKFGYERTYAENYQKGYVLCLLVSVIVLMPAGHYGAAMTHGSSYLTKYLPERLAVFAPLLGEGESSMETLSDSSLFGSQILPILEAKCFSCHGSDKHKGELRMDGAENCLAGGESGEPAYVEGDAMASFMVQLMLLPPEHEDVMPPKGDPPLEPGDTLLLAQWINRGAPWGAYEIPEPKKKPEKGEVTAVDPQLTEAIQLVDTYEIMSLFFEEPFETLRATLLIEPKKRKQMKAIYNSAYALGEAHNLLFSRSDEDYMSDPDWASLTVAGRVILSSIGESLKTKDYPKIQESFIALVESCNDCHERFELDVDHVDLVAPPPKEKKEKHR